MRSYVSMPVHTAPAVRQDSLVALSHQAWSPTLLTGGCCAAPVAPVHAGACAVRHYTPVVASPPTFTAPAARFLPPPRSASSTLLAPSYEGGPVRPPLPRYVVASAPPGMLPPASPLEFPAHRSYSSQARPTVTHVAPGNFGLQGSIQLFRRATSQFLSQTSGFSSSGTFRCPICYENIRSEERITFAACGNVSHGCCRECTSQYIRSLVSDGRVQIPCPQGQECGASASPEEVRRLVDAETYGKYKRFQQMQQDPTLRQCPGCKTLCKPAERTDGAIVAEMVCGSCGAEFCYYHSTAHTGRPCEDYAREIAREERRSLEGGAMKDSKACPQCGIMTDKLGGCNHMQCTTCKCDWCWSCGAVITNMSWHYNPGNHTGCQQFHDSNDAGGLLFKVLRLLVSPVMVLSITLFTLCAITLIFWIPFTLFVIGPCVKCNMNEHHCSDRCRIGNSAVSSFSNSMVTCSAAPRLHLHSMRGKETPCVLPDAGTFYSCDGVVGRHP